MLQVEYKLKLGQDEFTLKAEVKNEKEFFETMSFYSNLPRTAPRGSTDLKLVFRTTKQGHKYYSLISEKEKMEFKLGQNLENKGGGLFPKGWEPAYQGDNDEQVGTPAPAFGAQTTQQAQPAAAPAPAFGTQAMPTPQTVAAPAAVHAAPAPTPVAVQPQPAATPAPAPTAAPAAVNPQVAQTANNVLARFGIPQR